ncbi:FAD-linked oxidase C-terminal domain-containing protein [Streptomyces sp. NPDC051001]|uniref:FAD-linked oxidase C-terminal domain-containing protein n=1 Tax=Streptomyces sp. NPDC051001 TaxID=3155795 RepID=UPI00343D73E4
MLGGAHGDAVAVRAEQDAYGLVVDGEDAARLFQQQPAVPRSRLAEAVRESRAISARHDVPVFTIAARGGRQSAPDHRRGPVPGPASGGGGGDLRAGAAARGSGWPTSWGPPRTHSQRRLKEVFDPRGILNPGKSL